MPVLKDIDCWLADGYTRERYEEYLGNTRSDTGDNAKTCHIESNADTSFSINWKEDPDLGDTMFEISCDDRELVCCALDLTQHDSNITSCVGLQKSQGRYAPFKFGLNDVTGTVSLIPLNDC